MQEKKNQNSDGGEMEPDVCDTELHVQGRICAFKFSSAVGGFEWEHGGQCLCAWGRESAASVWTDGWIITKITHKLLAFFFFFFSTATVRAEGESAVTSGM